MRPTRPLLLAAALLLPLVSCGESTAPPTAATIELSVTELSFASLGLSLPVLAVVRDQQGNAMTTTFPTWTSSANTVATVNSAGTVTATGNGTATITATRGSAQATVTVIVAQVPTAFGYGSGANGDGLNSARGSLVKVPPAVRLLDANDRGVAGEAVTFTVLSGGGSVSAPTVATDANGVARAATWTLGPDLGPNTLEASYGGFSAVVFTVTGIEDPCVPVGAESLALGGSHGGTLASTDCEDGAYYYDLYRLEVPSPSGVVIEMVSVLPPTDILVDPFLELYASDNATLLAFDDDIVDGVIRDSRIVIVLEAGTYFLRASSFYEQQVGDYTISARTALIGVPATVTLAAGNGQVSSPNAPTPVLPSILVVDELGDPVADVAVTFATVPGVGSATGLNTSTNADGIATVGSWTIASGANVLAATIAGDGIAGNPAIFSATGSASTAGFNISLRFLTVPTQAQLQLFSDAAARWESIITGDVPAVPLAPVPSFCQEVPLLDETIDDIVIFVRFMSVDGPGGVLGAAGPCFIRTEGFLPLMASMRFDSADLGLASLPNVILHEMAHALGFGSIWEHKGLLVNPSLDQGVGVDTHFPGANAIGAFNAAGGNAYVGGAKVPVENTQGGEGTRDSHWREVQLKNELMTGFLSAGSNPLSAISIRSMQDLGYTVSVATADAYTFTPSIRADAPESGPTIHLLRDMLDAPPVVYNPRTPVPKKGPRGR